MRQKGTPKTGGRVKGTPNKVAKFEKELIADILSQYHASGQFADDFRSVEPEKRLDVIVRLAGFVLPKPQAVSLDVAATTFKNLDKLLRDLACE